MTSRPVPFRPAKFPPGIPATPNFFWAITLRVIDRSQLEIDAKSPVVDASERQFPGKYRVTFFGKCMPRRTFLARVFPPVFPLPLRPGKVEQGVAEKLILLMAWDRVLGIGSVSRLSGCSPAGQSQKYSLKLQLKYSIC